MAADQPDTARAALMRLRDQMIALADDEAWGVGYRGASEMWAEHIDRELAALPAEEPAPASAVADQFFEDARKKWPPIGNGRREGEPTRDGIEWLAWFCGKLWEVGVAPPGDSRLAAEIAGILAAERETAPASAGLVEAATEVVQCVGKMERPHFNGLVYADTNAVFALRDALAAERARKPDDRDATIAELRSELAIAAADRDEARAEEAAARLEIVELRQKLAKQRQAELRARDRVEDRDHWYESAMDWRKRAMSAEERAERADAALADARKEGLRELRELVERDATRPPAPSANSFAEHWYRYFLRMIDDRIAADTAPSKPEPDHPQYDADATLRDFVRINDGKDFSDMRDEALAELCRRAMGVSR